MKSLLVACNVHPDLDGFSCAVGYTEYLQRTGTYAVPGIFGIPDDEVQYVLKRFNIPVPQGEMNPDYYDEFILVDASQVVGIDRRIVPEKVIEIIDHREVNDISLFPKAKLQIEKVGAAATLIAEKFFNSNLQPTGHTALLLFGAVVSNTLNFQAAVTTERDQNAAKVLSNLIHVPEGFIREMFKAKSNVTGDLFSKKMRDKFAFFTLAGRRVGIVQIEIIGVDDVILNRLPEVKKVLNKFQEEMKLDYTLLSLVGLEEGYNWFVVQNEPTSQLLSSELGINFNDRVGKYENLIMRKELVLILQSALQA